jgi:hypothetical protein
MTTNTMRERFEAWLRSIWTDGYACPKNNDGSYKDPAAQRFWQCWNAALLSAHSVPMAEEKTRRAAFEDWWYTKINSGETPIEIAFGMHVEHIEAHASSPVQTAAARDVLAERERQKNVEGWTPEHDDEHDEGQLSMAACGYASRASDAAQDIRHGLTGGLTYDDVYIGAPGPEFWPHGWEFKAATPRRMLVKAGALILAEIERIDRDAAKVAK